MPQAGRRATRYCCYEAPAACPSTQAHTVFHACFLMCRAAFHTHTHAQELPSHPLKHLSGPCRAAHGQLTVKQYVNRLFCPWKHTTHSTYTLETPDVLRVWKLQHASMHMACRRQETHCSRVLKRARHPHSCKQTSAPLGVTATDSITPAHSAP